MKEVGSMEEMGAEEGWVVVGEEKERVGVGWGEKEREAKVDWEEEEREAEVV